MVRWWVGGDPPGSALGTSVATEMFLMTLDAEMSAGWFANAEYLGDDS